MISGTLVTLGDCPHCNEPGLYHRRRKGYPEVHQCLHCHSIFTPEELAEHGRNRATDQRVERGYRGCTAAAFIGCVFIGLLVIWWILDEASKG